MAPAPTPPLPPENQNENKRKSPPPSLISPASKRQRLDSPSHQAPLSSRAEREDSLSSLSPGATATASRGSFSPEVEGEGQVVGKIPATTSGGGGGQKSTRVGVPPPPPPLSLDHVEEEEDSNEDDDDDEDTVLPTVVHHELSAKTLPHHQPRPVDLVLNANGNGNGNGNGNAGANRTGTGRTTIGGKGKRGEEQLQHAVAAREEVERRRIENGQERFTGAPPLPSGANGSVVNGVPNGGGNAAKAMAAMKATLMGMVSNGSTAGGGLINQVVNVKVEEEELLKAGVGVEVVPGVEEEEEEDLGGPPLKRERPALTEERDNIIRFVVVTNDNTPSSLIILTGLKNIFQKQLPKMPREYIARLVYDRNHYSMAIVKRGLEVVGGITYRPFEARKFAEIVFCAITGTEQVKGYGSHLMNHLKDYVKEHTACMHFLTYADNYAIGYFKKQGFTKEVGLDRSVWAGYIKDYEGGTIMHCAMLEKIKYLELAGTLAKQKEVVLGEIRLLSRSHVIHPGLSLFGSLESGASLDPSQIPGLKESGWTPEMDDLTRRPKRGPQFAIMQRLLTLLNDHPSAWAFAHPVNAAEVTDYYDMIKEPMDLATMDRKLESNTYTNLVEFTDDAQRIFDNCRAYNDPGSNYVKNANKLELYLADQVKLFDQ